MVPDKTSRIVGIFGTPSSLTYWGIHVIRAIVGTLFGDYHFVHGHFLSEFEDAHAGRTDQGSAICVSDCPEVDVCELFLGSDIPVFVFIEEPIDVIGDLVSGGIDHVGALRLVTRSLCAIQPLSRAPDASVFRVEWLDRDLRSFVDAIAKAMHLDPTAEQKEAINRFLLPAGDWTGPMRDLIGLVIPSFAKRGDDAGTPNMLATQRIAEPYVGLVTGHVVERVEWPASIFSSGDAIGHFVGGPNELIGPARILIYGPYMHLPRGDWSAYVELEVCDNESGNRLKVDLVCGPDISASVTAEMPVEGHYCFTMPFTVAEPLQPVEMRFQIESGAIEGRFLLTRVVMTTGAASNSDILPERLAAFG